MMKYFISNKFFSTLYSSAHASLGVAALTEKEVAVREATEEEEEEVEV